MKVITAISGKNLREYADNRDAHPDSRVAIFPECSLDPNEQAAWLLENQDRFDEVITFSPFIISDATRDELVILDGEDDYFHHQGDSVNKITMCLHGRRETVGDRVTNYFKNIHEEWYNGGSNIDELMKKADKMGDSVEKILLIKTLMGN